MNFDRNTTAPLGLTARAALGAVILSALLAGCTGDGDVNASGGGSGGSSLSGTYAASHGGETITIEFLGGNKAKLFMEDASGQETEDATYVVAGDTVTISTDAPESVPMVLTMKGDALLGSMPGMTFVKK